MVIRLFGASSIKSSRARWRWPALRVRGVFGDACLRDGEEAVGLLRSLLLVEKLTGVQT